MADKYLYGLTVQGIQSYIFETNKLREIVGASEIIEQICTEMLCEILGSSYNKKNSLQAAAGSVKYLFENSADAEKAFEKFPEKIKVLAGDIVFSQAIIKVTGEPTGKNFTELEKKIRAARNNPVNKPVLATMGSELNRRTGNAEYLYNKLAKENLDYTTNKKVENKATLLLKKITQEKTWAFPNEMGEITNDKNKNYVALIHADGNKLGATIQKILNSDIKNKPTFLRSLSEKIEQSTVNAFKKAFDTVIEKNKNFEETEKNGKTIKNVPLRPIILGGDDLTLIIRADLAIDFTKEYLQEFEKQTEENFQELINDNSNNEVQNLRDGLTATAGIVFVKKKYPFHYAANLVENITSDAKNRSGRDKSTLLFYRVQDSFVNSYNDIVKTELCPNGFDFMNGPYDTKEIEMLLTRVSLLKKEDMPRGALREVLTLMYNNVQQAKFKWKRIFAVNGNTKNFKGLELNHDLMQNKILYDLITLDSLTTDN